MMVLEKNSKQKVQHCRWGTATSTFKALIASWRCFFVWKFGLKRGKWGSLKILVEESLLLLNWSKILTTSSNVSGIKILSSPFLSHWHHLIYQKNINLKPPTIQHLNLNYKENKHFVTNLRFITHEFAISLSVYVFHDRNRFLDYTDYTINCISHASSFLCVSFWVFRMTNWSFYHYASKL